MRASKSSSASCATMLEAVYLDDDGEAVSRALIRDVMALPA